MTTTCFDALGDACRTLGEELYNTSDMDRTVLSAMAAIIAREDELTPDQVCSFLNSYNSTASYLSYVELLWPDNTMLEADGTTRDVSGGFDFAADAVRGPYVSDISYSTLDPDARVIRNAVPVVRNGETIAILYGVARLDELAARYTTDIYDGHVYVYLMDGDTGNFLLDTWHKSYGNVRDVSNRQMLPGYNFDTAIANMKVGGSGNLGFVSKTIGQPLYMHYEPVGINNWTVAVTVAQEYALQESLSVRRLLYRMATVIAGVLLLYIVCVSVSLYSAYRQVKQLATSDQTTGLQNRTAYERYMAASLNRKFGSIVCIYIDANGLHEVNNRFGHAVGDQMLRIIAAALREQFDDHAIYRIGGDEFVVFCEDGTAEGCTERIEQAALSIESHDYSISYGIVCRTDEVGVDRVAQEADERMLDYKRSYYATHERHRSR